MGSSNIGRELDSWSEYQICVWNMCTRKAWNEFEGKGKIWQC